MQDRFGFGASSTFERALVVVLAIVACLALMRGWQLGQSVAGIDYYQFWVVGEAVDHDAVTNPYSDRVRAHLGERYLERSIPSSRRHAAAQARSVLETYSTPFLYTAVHALASGNYERDFARWHAMSLVAFVFGVVAFGRMAGMGFAAALTGLILIVALAAPFQSEAQVANVNRAQLGGLALAGVLLGRRDSNAALFAAGAILGASTMFKPNVAIAIFLVACAIAILRGRGAALSLGGGIAGGAALCFALSVFFFHSAQAWSEWARTLSVIPDEIIRVSLGNYAPLPILLGGMSGTTSALSAGVLCVPVVYALWRARERPDDFEPSQLAALVIGLGCVIALMSATLVWEHYFLLAFPLGLAVAGNAFAGKRMDVVAWLRFRILPAVAFLGLLATPAYGISGLPHETYFPLVQGSALVILYALGVWWLADPPRVDVDQASSRFA